MLKVEGLHKRFAIHSGRVNAVHGVSFEVAKGEFLSLLGPSGCGKTTTLRCIAGLEKPDDGEITIGGKVVYSGPQNTFVPPQQRDISMVFQSYAIWPHMTVYGNVAYPLAGKVPKPARREKVMDALRTVGIEHLAERPAPQLSGGQQQRVALARAIVKGAEVLLLDEPLSNLDVKLRVHMRAELRELRRQLGITTIYVTHDQEEALALSDRVAVMSGGEIVELDTPAAIYKRPKTYFTADFVGASNLVPATISPAANGASIARTAFGVIECVDSGDIAGKAVVSIRPEHIEIASGDLSRAGQPNTYRGTVRSALFVGRSTDCLVQVGALDIKVQVSSVIDIVEGQEVYLRFPAHLCIAMAVD